MEIYPVSQQTSEKADTIARAAVLDSTVLALSTDVTVATDIVDLLRRLVDRIHQAYHFETMVVYLLSSDHDYLNPVTYFPTGSIPVSYTHLTLPTTPYV